VLGKGKKSEEHKFGADADWDAIKKAAIGRSGKLRAPAIKVGKTWLVGWSEEAWTKVFG